MRPELLEFFNRNIKNCTENQIKTFFKSIQETIDEYNYCHLLLDDIKIVSDISMPNDYNRKYNIVKMEKIEWEEIKNYLKK